MSEQANYHPSYAVVARRNRREVVVKTFEDYIEADEYANYLGFNGRVGVGVRRILLNGFLAEEFGP